jgi:uncharacterized protein (TIGR03437 family)
MIADGFVKNVLAVLCMANGGVLALAATYTTVPIAVTATYSQPLTLQINRTLGQGEEGFSADEMDSFNWYGPSSPYPSGIPVKLPHATLLTQVSLTVLIAPALLTTAGTATITYIADPDDTHETRVITLTINPVPQITTAGFAPLRTGLLYSLSISAAGGTSEFSWSLAAGSFPTGMGYLIAGINPVKLFGTPTASGTYNFTVRVTDASGVSAQKAFSLSVSDPPRISSPTQLPAATVGIRYFISLQSTGGLAPLAWTVRAGTTPPPGVTLDPSGILVGTPTTAGTFFFVVDLNDALSPTQHDGDSGSFSLTVAPPLQITTNTLTAGVKGAAYSFPLQAIGGQTPYQWSLAAGNLPGGLALSVAGVVSGTPSATGTFNFTARVSDANLSVSKAFTLVIDSAGLVGPFTSLHGATFQTTTSAAEAIVAGFGVNLAPGTASNSDANLPVSLLGISVNVKDSAGHESAAPLFFVSSGQINYVVPAGLALGAATVAVRSGAQTIATGSLQLDRVEPGFFTANADGNGVPSALTIRVRPDLSQISSLVYQCGTAAGSCSPLPIDLGSDPYYLLLFGTGIRGRTDLTGVTATIGGVSVPVKYAGDQREYPGLDQVNLGPLPLTLQGRGSVQVLVTVDGKNAPAVTVAFR